MLDRSHLIDCSSTSKIFNEIFISLVDYRMLHVIQSLL